MDMDQVAGAGIHCGREPIRAGQVEIADPAEYHHRLGMGGKKTELPREFAGGPKIVSVEERDELAICTIHCAVAHHGRRGRLAEFEPVKVDTK